jgi:hypothetical protein
MHDALIFKQHFISFNGLSAQDEHKIGKHGRISLIRTHCI